MTAAAARAPRSPSWSASATRSCRPAWAGSPARGWSVGTANAGGLGILASATMTFEELEQAIVEVKSRTDQPFGVNLRADAGDAADALRPADQARREGGVVRARPQAGADQEAQGPRHRRDAVDRRRQARGQGRRLGRRRGDGPGRRGRRPHRTGADHAAAADRARRRRHPGRRRRRLLRRPRARRRAVVRRGRRSAWAPASCSPRTPPSPTRSSSSTSSTDLTGTVVTAKVDGMPHRMLRTAFVEEVEETSARQADSGRRCKRTLAVQEGQRDVLAPARPRRPRDEARPRAARWPR